MAIGVTAAANGATLLTEPVKALVNDYCVSCHDAESKKGGLDLEQIIPSDVTQHPDAWEEVVRKLRARQMPPIGKKRPADGAYDEAVAWLSSTLDAAATTNPNPGR